MAREKPIDLEKVEHLAGAGLTEEQIALCLGISRRTLERRKAAYDTFVTAISRGKSKAAAMVANVLFDKATAGDLSAVIWYEKTRQGRSDRIIHTGTMTHEHINADEETILAAAEEIRFRRLIGDVGAGELDCVHESHIP